MQYFNSLKIAYRALKVHRLRSILTILGIVIGITSVIMVFSAGEGLKKVVLGQVDAWGSDTIEVEIKVPSTSHTSSENASNMAMGVTITTLKHEDALAIKQHPNISDAYSAVIGQAIVTGGNVSEITQLWGLSVDYLKIDTWRVASGRFYTDEEDRGLARVAVIGSKVREEFFGDADAVGKYLKVGKYNFKVIGVMEERGAIMYMNMDELILVPLQSLQKLIMGIDHVAFIMAKIKDMTLAEATAEDLTLMMRDRHNISDPVKDDFVVITMAEAMEMLNTILGAVTLLLLAIAGVSLIVGGVGIMNIMFVSVTERTYEIGLRKAVGANSRNILIQFLWEAIALTFIGGVIGIILGVLFSYLIFLVASRQGLTWAFIVKPWSLLIAAGVSVLIGLIFGLYPAQKAAKKDPIEALRFEH